MLRIKVSWAGCFLNVSIFEFWHARIRSGHVGSVFYAVSHADEVAPDRSETPTEDISQPGTLNTPTSQHPVPSDEKQVLSTHLKPTSAYQFPNFPTLPSNHDLLLKCRPHTRIAHSTTPLTTLNDITFPNYHNPSTAPHFATHPCQTKKQTFIQKLLQVSMHTGEFLNLCLQVGDSFRLFHSDVVGCFLVGYFEGYLWALFCCFGE